MKMSLKARRNQERLRIDRVAEPVSFVLVKYDLIKITRVFMYEFA